jgi:hypothetical protein
MAKNPYKEFVGVNPLKYLAQQALRMGMVDSVAAYINKGYYLEFSRIADEDFSVQFYAFVETFSDSFTANFQQESVFGRTDPIPSYQNTQRSISMSWSLLAHNEESAAKNLNDIKGLAQMMYPTYTKHGDQRTFSSAPIIGMRYINFVNEEGEYLAGTINNFSFTPDLEFGVFEDESTGILPKIIRVNCTFNPIHRRTLGFNGSGKFLGPYYYDFPYQNKVEFTPGEQSEVEFSKEYLKGFKEGDEAGKIDKAYSDVLQARYDEMFKEQNNKQGFFSKLFNND